MFFISSLFEYNSSAAKETEVKKETISKCYQCLQHCNPANVPYRITKALVNAVRGDLDHGLIFCGANVGRIKEMMSVHDLMQELQPAEA